MTQNRTRGPAFDLDDLERELKKASAPREASPSDDPLAELARIVGQDQPKVRGPAARDPFEEFLAQSGGLQPPVAHSPGAFPGSPVKTPSMEPLFPEGLPKVAEAPPAASAEIAAAAVAVPAEVVSPPKYIDPLEALLAQDIGLRSGIDDLPPAPPSAVVGPQIHDMIREIEWPSESLTDPIVPEAAKEPDAATGSVAEVAAEPVAATVLPEPVASPPAVNPDKPAFDDMLAEFEAAMRDTAGQSVRAQTEPAEPMISPPPGDIYVPPPPVRLPEPPVETVPAVDGHGAATIAAGAAFAGGAAAVAAKARPKRGIMLAGGAIAVAVIGLGALAMFSGNKGPRVPAGAVPVIEARSGASKERPANPGGVEVPNQDKEILQSRPATTTQPVRVAPREEQPVDLTEAQRQAAAAVTVAPGVRQIAGVTPTTGAPVTEPTPRPVASVPIIISGQSSSAPAPIVTAPAAPVPAAPAAIVPATPATPAPAAGAPVRRAPAASAPVAAAPAQPGTAQPGTAQPTTAQPPSEPRRVRSVPIRPETEAAPQRAQTQPRVVPAAPQQAAAPADPNGPLSITPQSNRAAPAPTRQAAVAQGSVPSSVPSLSDPDPAPPLRTATAASGSGFAVQLAAEGSEDAARAKFNRMRSQYGSVLGSSSPSIRSAEVNGRSVYRVRVGNMSREEAVSLCERLKSSGGSCFVARN